MTIYMSKWNGGKEAELGRTGKPMKGLKKIGGPDGARTHDLMTASHALSQTELQAHSRRATSILLDVGKFCKKCAGLSGRVRCGAMNQGLNKVSGAAGTRSLHACE